MPVPSWISDAAGNWAGESRLHLSYLEDESKRIQASPSVLELAHDPALTYAIVSYAWQYEGEPQSGVMVLCVDTASWTDSFHQSACLMSLKSDAGDDRVSFLGSYPAGEGPDWGWRIELLMEGQELVFKMTNIEPDQEGEWAVEGRYSRAE